jgi:hypothetical protein
MSEGYTAEGVSFAGGDPYPSLGTPAQRCAVSRLAARTAAFFGAWPRST